MLRKTPILILCLIGIGFFLYRVIANTKPATKDVKTSINETNSSTKTSDSNPNLSNRVLKVVPIKKNSYYERLINMMQKSLINEPQAQDQLCNNSNFKRLFKTENPVLGFYGDDRYKIEYFISETNVRKDEPQRVYIKGLSKYKKNIRTIDGYFEVNAVALNHEDQGEKDVNKNYSVKGNFYFDESHGDKNVGKYYGTWLADISEIINEKHELEFGIPDKPFAFGNELLLSGYWQNASGDMIKDLCFSQNIYAVGADIFKAFSYGDRDVSINEAFASKGWDELYSDNNWWEVKN